MDLEIKNLVQKDERIQHRLSLGSFDRGIIVWRWEDAPKYLCEFSTHGGDEDGVVWIPSRLLPAPWWLERLWEVYGNDQDFIQFNDGLLIIWAHG